METLKHFTILNLPYIKAKKMDYGQFPNLSCRILLLLYWYSTNNPTPILIMHFQKKGGLGKYNYKD